MGGTGTDDLGAPPAAALGRLARPTAALDDAERGWWQEYADLEDQYCWVQPTSVRRSLRGPYVRRLLSAVRSGGTVLELGCGTGWLAVLFAEAGAATVIGLDESAEQISRAVATAESSGVGDRVRFTTGTEPPDVDGGYDLVVVHALLHHLSTAEAREVVAAARRAVRPDGLVVLVEPVLRPLTTSPLELRVLRKLERLPMGLARRRLRRIGSVEADVRARLSRRHVAEAPRGPSPKELPFVEGELDDLVAGELEVVHRERCLSYAHLVAQEALIAGLSQPRFWRATLGVLLPVAHRLDRRLLRRPSPPTWVFEALSCRPLPRPSL